MAKNCDSNVKSNSLIFPTQSEWKKIWAFHWIMISQNCIIFLAGNFFKIYQYKSILRWSYSGTTCMTKSKNQHFRSTNLQILGENYWRLCTLFDVLIRSPDGFLINYRAYASGSFFKRIFSSCGDWSVNGQTRNNGACLVIGED